MTARARVGVVAVLLGAGVVVGQATAGPVPEPPSPQPAPVVAATAVCPDVRHEGERGETAVAAGGAADLAARPVGAPARPARPGAELAAQDVGAFVVRSSGSGAGGLTAEQATRATAGARRGIASVGCPAPATDFWFVGGATVVGSVAELLLVNVEDVDAVVDVRVWSADGPTDPRPGRGLTVGARSRLAVPLDRLAPDRDLLALHVQTTRGRVAAALRVIRTDGRIPLGVDWVPPAEPPAREAVVPGLPQGPGRRTALLTNPGDVDALVAVELQTDDGRYVPEQLAAVPVPAGTSVGVDLSELLADTPAALRVLSDGVPVLAGALVVDRQDGPVREIAFAASAAAVDAPALLADVRLSAPTEVTLLLSASDGDATVDLVSVGAPGDLPDLQRVEVPAATTVTVRLSRFLPPGSTGSLAVELRPVRGAVHAARYVRERGARGPLTSLLPLESPRTTVLRPAVVADPGAGR